MSETLKIDRPLIYDRSLTRVREFQHDERELVKEMCVRDFLAVP